jgi:hypothetical protein
VPDITSPSSWRAVYDDGTTLDEGPGRYAEMDRSRLVRFALYREGMIAPIWTVHVDPGRRLVYRARVWPRTGRRMLMVGTESEDRSDVDMHLIDLEPDVVWHGHIDAYGEDATTGAPVLYDFEQGVRF